MKVSTHPTPEKQPQMLDLLKYGTVMAFVDSRHPGVIVPDHLKGDHQLRLNFDYAFDIDDFRVLPDRLEASLSFNQKNFFCVIPFEAVYLMLNNSIQRASLFVESVPVEMLDILTTAEKQPGADTSRLKTIPGAASGAATAPSASPSADPEKKVKKRGNHLRVVK